MLEDLPGNPVAHNPRLLGILWPVALAGSRDLVIAFRPMIAIPAPLTGVASIQRAVIIPVRRSATSHETLSTVTVPDCNGSC